MRVFNTLLSDLQRLIGRATKKPRMKNPPEGIMPRFLFEEQRLWDLGLAIDRYKAAGKEVPRAWTIEHKDLCDRLYGSTFAEEIYSKVAAIIDGIDRTVDDDRGGWWQTKDGAQVGKIKLIQLKDLIFEQFSSGENI
jgi:hypothetical protein